MVIWQGYQVAHGHLVMVIWMAVWREPLRSGP